MLQCLDSANESKKTNEILMRIERKLDRLEEQVNTKVGEGHIKSIVKELLEPKSRQGEIAKSTSEPSKQIESNKKSLTEKEVPGTSKESNSVPAVEVKPYGELDESTDNDVILETSDSDTIQAPFEDRFDEEIESDDKTTKTSWAEVVNKKKPKVRQVEVKVPSTKEMKKPLIKDTDADIVEKINNVAPQAQGRQNQGTTPNRDLNILIHRAPESTCITQQGRRREDETMVKTLCEVVLQQSEVEPKNIFRLGPPQIGKTRPIKVEFSHKEDKLAIMRNLFRLQHTEEPFRIMSITNDLSQEERDENRKLVMQAKQLNEEDNSSEWVYKVRGPPWDRRIVRLKKEVE